MTKYNQCVAQQDANNRYYSDKEMVQKSHYEMNRLNQNVVHKNQDFSENLTNMLESKMNGLMSLEMIDDSSSMSSIASTTDEHILAPKCMAGKNRPCLTWACRACKKKSVAVDRRKAATLRERRRLRKVKENTEKPSAKIFVNIIT